MTSDLSLSLGCRHPTGPGEEGTVEVGGRGLQVEPRGERITLDKFTRSPGEGPMWVSGRSHPRSRDRVRDSFRDLDCGRSLLTVLE